MSGRGLLAAENVEGLPKQTTHGVTQGAVFIEGQRDELFALGWQETNGDSGGLLVR